MKSALLYFGSILFFFSSCTDDRSIKENKVILDPDSILMFYWNFNTLLGTNTSVTPDFSLPTATAAITYDGSGDGYMDGDTGGYTINSRNNDPADNLLKVRNPSHTRSLVITAPTTDYKKIVLQFATARSNNGATVQNYTYTIDGMNYVSTGMVKTTHATPVDPTIDLVTLDFSNITTIDNNPNFRLKIDFGGDSAAGLTGNNRFDNITIEGTPILP